jgi:predicted dehydrogenase
MGTARTLGVGVIGLGFFGQRHARIYRENPAAELMAVCDIDAKLAAAAGEKLKAHACKDFEALLARGGRRGGLHLPAGPAA